MKIFSLKHKCPDTLGCCVCLRRSAHAFGNDDSVNGSCGKHTPDRHMEDVYGL